MGPTVPSLNKNEGAITFNEACSNTSYPNLPKIIHNPEVGDILLFPSSLYHGTIPFSTDTDRIVVSFDLKITRLARGLPMGGDLEYADFVTLSRAIEGRQVLG